jgi:hypothetical protein
MTAQDPLHSLLDYECLLLWLTWFWFTTRSLLLRMTQGEWRITRDFSFTNELPVDSSRNESLWVWVRVLYHDRRSVGQSVLE